MDFNCYHECENCGIRCNCADQPCSCCIVNKIKSPCCTMIKTPIHKNQTVWAKLHTEKRKHIVKSNVYEGDFYVYKCEMCGTGYTTTESDTLSLNNLKQKKL